MKLTIIKEDMESSSDSEAEAQVKSITLGNLVSKRKSIDPLSSFTLNIKD